jgi:hypothetical protein
VLVVSRGDEQFVRLEGRRGWHFPRHEDGRWGGFHPADSGEAIAHLESLRSKGAQYLVFPQTAFWWIDYYEEFGQHLEGRYRLIASSESCRIYDIRVNRAARGDGLGHHSVDPTAASEVVLRLLPHDATIGVVTEEGKEPAGFDPERTVPFRPGADDDSAVEGLAQLARSGVEFLVIPSSEYGWLQQHSLFARNLRERHTFVMRQQHLCEIYELSRD